MWGRRTRKAPYQWQGPHPTAPSTASPSAPPSEPPQYSEPPNECFPLQHAVVGREQVYVPFQLSDLRETKRGAPDKYIQAFISVIQTFELAWKDIMLLLDQTISSLEKQQILAQTTHNGDNFQLQ
jgi:hypothetical protein